MFGFFKSPKPSVKLNDKVWISRQAKFAACVEMQKLNPQFLFIAWFEETQDELHKSVALETENIEILLAANLNKTDLHNRIPAFIEHYPLADIEMALFLHLGLQEVYVFSALDEPLFLLFGGERTITLMEKLGLQPYEEIAHPMITKSIHRAQKSIAEKVQMERKASSQDRWFALNLKAT